MRRLANTADSLGHPLDYLKLSSMVSQEHQLLLGIVQAFCQEHLHTEQFKDCYQRAQFPHYLMPLLDRLSIAQYFVPAPEGKELPLLVQGLIIAAFAAHDLGVSTFLFLQLPLSARTISLLGSKAQKQKVLPELMSLKKICGWALTERQVGSNSTRLGTNFQRRGEELVLKGNKRWIGNGVHDYLIVYGNLQGEKRVVGALLDMKTDGVSAQKIENKYSFRLVQNGQIDFHDVRLQQSDLMPGADSYRAGVEDVIKHSRMIVIWNAVGASIGVYNVALRKVRSQPILASSSQVQERLVMMMGEVQAMLLSAWRLTELTLKLGGLEIATVGMFKAWVTSRGRVVAGLGREVVGGRGVAGEELMKKLLDLEALYTYEGSYDMNTLLAGSQLTGIKAFT